MISVTSVPISTVSRDVPAFDTALCEMGAWPSLAKALPAGRGLAPMLQTTAQRALSPDRLYDDSGPKSVAWRQVPLDA